MADNVTLNSGSGGAVVKTDDDGTAHWQYVKLAHGADNTQTRVTNSAGLPVTPDSSGFTVALSATDNAVLDTIDAVLDAIKIDTEAIETAVEGTLTVSGTVTANLSATDNAVLDNIQAAVEIIDNAISGSEMQVDIVANADTIADDAAFTPGTSPVFPAGATFDDTTPDSVDEGDIGAVRMSANRNLYQTIRDAAGNERGANVDASNRLTVLADLGTTDNAVLDAIAADTTAIKTAVEILDNAISGNEMQVDIVSGAGGTLTDDSAFTPGSSATVASGGVFDDVTPDSVDEGDVGALRMSANRVGYRTIRDAAGNERGANVDASNRLTVLADLGSTDNAVLDAIAADGDAIQTLLTTIDSVLDNIDAETSNIQTAVELLDDTVKTDDAAFTPATDKVLMVGATFDDTATDSVDEGDAGAIRMTSDRRLKVDGSDSTQPVSGTVTANLSATDNAVLDNIQTAVELIDNAISGSEMQVDVVTLPGTVEADIAAIKTAVEILDNAISGNEMQVDIVSGAGGGITDDSAYTVGTNDALPSGGLFDDVTPDSVDEGDIGILRMSANRVGYRTIRDAAGNERGANVTASNELNVLESNSAAILADTANMDTNLGTVAGAVSGTEMQVDVVNTPTVTANLSATDNAVLDNIQAAVEIIDNAISGNEMQVDVLTMPTTTVTGTVAVSSADVVGNVAHDAADSGDPIKTGGKARTAEPTAVGNADRVDAQYDSTGVLISRHCLHEELVDGQGSATGTANTSIIAAGGAGIRTYVTDVWVTNASATDSEIILKDGTTEKMRLPAPANSGAVFGLRSPIRGTANTAVQFASADAVTTMYVGCSGYQSSV